MSKITGGCLCGEVRYEMEGVFNVAVCHCRECQYASGGGPNYIALVPTPAVRLHQGRAPSLHAARWQRPGGDADLLRGLWHALGV